MGFAYRYILLCTITGGADPGADSRYIGPTIPHLPAQDVVDVLHKWDGMEDTIALLNEIIQREKGMYMNICTVCKYIYIHVHRVMYSVCVYVVQMIMKTALLTETTCTCRVVYSANHTLLWLGQVVLLKIPYNQFFTHVRKL